MCDFEKQLLTDRFIEVLARYYNALIMKGLTLSDFDDIAVQRYHFVASVKNELMTATDDLFLRHAEIVLNNAEGYIGELLNRG